jgi:hypothetical protein
VDREGAIGISVDAPWRAIGEHDLGVLAACCELVPEFMGEFFVPALQVFIHIAVLEAV